MKTARESMDMLPEYSRARIEKDRNYDGKFFFAVKTTGIFCRPSCPAPVAREENVEYFETMFEALEKGYRPCLRCRPDMETEYCNTTSGGASAINGALKMIYDGYLNYGSLKGLAFKLGISDRHLRKLFIDSLGVPPVKIARYHKALFAKKMLVSSDRPITDIALCSGFGSIRQFNDVFRNIFGKTPTMVRKERPGPASPRKGTALYLKYDKPFDFEQLLGFLRPRTIPGVESVDGGGYSRTFRTQKTSGFFTVRDAPDRSALKLDIFCEDIKCFMEIHNRVRRMFDLDTDFSSINDRFSRDPILSKGMTGGQVPRLPVAFAPFEAMVRAILGQQITVKAATTLAGRLAKAAGGTTGKGFPPGLDLFFPNPEEITGMDLDGLGLTATRQATLRAATRAVAEARVRLTANQGFETFRKDFLAVKGIGDWTANYVAMRGLGMMDGFPAGDLGVIKALTAKGDKPSQKKILEMADKWRPFRTYATLCLWNTDPKEN